MQHNARLNPQFFRNTFGLLVCLAILFTTAGFPSARAAQAQAFRTANNILLAPGADLPVFHFLAPTVTGEGVQGLGNLFPPLAEQNVNPDNYLGKPRFTLANEKTGTLLEQFGATGGFYAFNPTEAYDETFRGKLDPAEAQRQACLFLLTNELQHDALVNVPLPQSCDYNFTDEYDITEAFTSAEGEGANTQAILIGMIVQVPIALNTGRFSQFPTIPLGGPGGHISLLFRTTDFDEGFSLDPQVAPGLAAAALPFYGRQMEFDRLLPAADPEVLKKQVEDYARASFPGAETVTVPDPSLIYWASDAAVEQAVLEPVFEFEGVSVTEDGQTIFFKDIVLPAVEGGETGLGPTVAITSPTNGSLSAPWAEVTLTANITDGTKPYHLVWSLEDGTVLHEGDQAEPGTANLNAGLLSRVARTDIPGPVLFRLSVTDAEGVTRQASVSVAPTPSIWMPFLSNGAGSQTTPSFLAAAPAPSSVQANLLATNYSFGVESGSDYPPYGPGGSDLPGVVPDAGGFRSEMAGLGWTQKFNWANANAWEKDWRDCSLGGIDCTYGVDRVDFAYWAGHGSNGGISLPSNRDSGWFPGDNARYQNLRWAGFASCLTLRAQWTPAANAPIRKWFNAFQGAHMLLGFNSLMADIAFGPRLVDNMRMPTFLGFEIPWAQKTIREAWVHTAFTMNAGKPAYIYAVGTNGVNPANNKLPKANDPLLPRPYPVASWHWVWWND